MENIQKTFERKRWRCKACGKRFTPYIFKRGKKKYCKCPKCWAEARWFEK